MGRVRNASVPADKGIPGKLYFDEPTVVNIEGLNKPKNPFPQSGFVKIETKADAVAHANVVRLRSSHTLHNYLPPEDVVYDMGRWPNQLEINAYLKASSIAGYDEGAIVCRRFQPKGRWKYPSQWGLIIVKHKISPGSSQYAPYAVKWFADATIESAWAEDLVVIHAALSMDLIRDIVEEQGVEVGHDD